MVALLRPASVTRIMPVMNTGNACTRSETRITQRPRRPAAAVPANSPEQRAEHLSEARGWRPRRSFTSVRRRGDDAGKDIEPGVVGCRTSGSGRAGPGSPPARAERAIVWSGGGGAPTSSSGRPTSYGAIYGPTRSSAPADSKTSNGTEPEQPRGTRRTSRHVSPVAASAACSAGAHAASRRSSRPCTTSQCQIDEQRDRGDHQQHALDRRIIEGEHRSHRVLADAAERKYGLRSAPRRPGCSRTAHPAGSSAGASAFFSATRATVWSAATRLPVRTTRSRTRARRIMFWRTIFRIGPDSTNTLVATGNARWASPSFSETMSPARSESIVMKRSRRVAAGASD